MPYDREWRCLLCGDLLEAHDEHGCQACGRCDVDGQGRLAARAPEPTPK